ncbi:MAG: hypothetical protein FJ121_02495 [Deltaproteobacteria bacterium]|nr:hypothetical protein [Deltaproteobacteria bacterium]
MKNLRRKTTWLHLVILLVLVGAAVHSLTWAGWLRRPESLYSDLWHRLAGLRYKPAHVAMPLLLAESAVRSEEAEKLELRRSQEQQERGKMQQQEQQQQRQPSMKKMRGPMPEAAPSKPGTSRFGAGVIRNKDSEDGD